jgi:hypothetical protein
VTLQRYVGIVVPAEPRCSYSIRRLDDGAVVSLTRREGNRTNFRLRIGDKIRFSTYRSTGRLYAFDPVLLNVNRRREPIIKPPPYAALGPVLRVGVVPFGMRG